mmetsp:Transcript_29198/g.57259  ORF Transcript_29198/g.57259 Transcript_29198/m.57259 type:complete len:322 (+) Transcript_29198:2046-3011(+)
MHRHEPNQRHPSTSRIKVSFWAVLHSPAFTRHVPYGRQGGTNTYMHTQDAREERCKTRKGGEDALVDVTHSLTHSHRIQAGSWRKVGGGKRKHPDSKRHLGVFPSLVHKILLISFLSRNFLSTLLTSHPAQTFFLSPTPTKVCLPSPPRINVTLFIQLIHSIIQTNRPFFLPSSHHSLKHPGGWGLLEGEGGPWGCCRLLPVARLRLPWARLQTLAWGGAQQIRSKRKAQEEETGPRQPCLSPETQMGQTWCRWSLPPQACPFPRQRKRRSRRSCSVGGSRSLCPGTSSHSGSSLSRNCSRIGDPPASCEPSPPPRRRQTR